MNIESVFNGNQKLQDFVEFCKVLEEDITLLSEAKPSHIYGLLALWLSTHNIAIVLTDSEVISFFINPSIESAVDMNSFLFDKDSSFVIINRRPKDEYYLVILNSVEILKAIR